MQCATVNGSVFAGIQSSVFGSVTINYFLINYLSTNIAKYVTIKPEDIFFELDVPYKSFGR